MLTRSLIRKIDLQQVVLLRPNKIKMTDKFQLFSAPLKNNIKYNAPRLSLYVLIYQVQYKSLSPCKGTLGISVYATINCDHYIRLGSRMAKEKFGWIQFLKIVRFKIKLLNVYEEIISGRLYRVKYWMLNCFKKGKTLSNTV